MSIPMHNGQRHSSPARAGAVDSARGWSRMFRSFVLDRGAAGSFNVLVRLVGLALRYQAHRRWVGVVNDDTTKALLARHPRLAYRHTSPYLFDGASWSMRLRMLEAHYAFLNRVHDAAFFNHVIERNGVAVWSIATGGHLLSIRLHGPCVDSFHREGDLSLAFLMNGVPLFKLAFSIVPGRLFTNEGARAATSDVVVYIGQVQGMPGRWDRIREATKLCRDVAPQDLLMSALAGAAEAWGIGRIFGVTATRQLAFCEPDTTATTFDYSAFWARHLAAPTADGHHRIDLPLAQKPIDDIAARHRKRTLAKRRFKESARLQVAAAIGREMRPAERAAGRGLPREAAVTSGLRSRSRGGT